LEWPFFDRRLWIFLLNCPSVFLVDSPFEKTIVGIVCTHLAIIVNQSQESILRHLLSVMHTNRKGMHVFVTTVRITSRYESAVAASATKAGLMV